LSTDAGTLAIPQRLNLLLLLASVLANVALLWKASHAPLGLALLCALAFSFTANTTFSLLHESVHGMLHRSAAANRWAGRLAAAFFPTSFSIQRVFHLTHHRFNRSEFERFDYIQPGESAWLKKAQWYSILTGFYWVVTVLGLLIYMLLPFALRHRALRDARLASAKQTASVAYLAALDGVDPLVGRLEIAGSFAVQAFLFYSLDLSLLGWGLCYGAFALQWSSLQYADHAYSPLDRRDGAWDLRVNPVSRAFFLNYHYHLAHHRHPNVPWLHLPALAERDAPQPSYLDVWCRMWRGPRNLPASHQ
jgi:fatty acid desaturase